MTVSVCMTAYDRVDLLRQALQNLVFTYPCGADKLVIYSDGSGDPNIEFEIENTKWATTPMAIVPIISKVNRGIANATQRSMSFVEGDVLIHIDSDTFVKRAGWARDMGQFLTNRPEIGILAPDLSGRYMRIKRPDYDEIEYSLGMIMAVRKEVFRAVSGYRGEGFFDEDLHHQYDPDVCYRVRMLGYRVGVVDIGEVVTLGLDSGDSSKSSSVWKGGFEFLQKWNMKFLGNRFRYKSPEMLRWDEFPLNYVWRKQWLSQFPYNEQPKQESVQDHSFNMIQFPITPGKWNLEATRDCVRANINLAGVDRYEDVDQDLLAGKRSWQVSDISKIIERKSNE